MLFDLFIYLFYCFHFVLVTVVWEKLVVGNIHEKNSVVKIFVLAG